MAGVVPVTNSRRSRTRWLLPVDGVCVVLFVLLAVVPWSAWVNSKLELQARLGGPTMAHPLGTDALGRDLLVRLAQAVQQGVLPLWLVVITASAIGALLAVTAIASAPAGAQPRRSILVATTRVLDGSAVLLTGVPLGIVVFAWAALSEAAGLVPVAAALSIFFVGRAYLQVRDLYRHDRHLAYWTAHAALGGTLWARLWRYGVRGSWRRSLVATLGFHLRAAVGIEASLSYLGYGIQEPAASFGNMLAAHFDLYLRGQWHVLAVIAAVLALTAAFPARLLALLQTRWQA